MAAPELTGRVALVTGASRGIGAAVARRLAGAGVALGLGSRSGDDLGIEGAVARATDVRDPAAVDALVAATLERHGRLDIVVANAGVGAYGPFLELDPEQLDLMIDVNLKGVMHTARAALPHLIAGGGGDFVSLASVAGVRAFPGEAVYNASKFGQVGLHQGARRRAARARRALHLDLPGRRRDGLRDGHGTHGGHARARRDDERGGCRRRRHVRDHPTAGHADADDDVPADDRSVVGIGRKAR